MEIIAEEEKEVQDQILEKEKAKGKGKEQQLPAEEDRAEDADEHQYDIFAEEAGSLADSPSRALEFSSPASGSETPMQTLADILIQRENYCPTAE